jgi:hypothetical protein
MHVLSALTGRVFTGGKVFGAQYGPEEGKKKDWKPVALRGSGDDLQNDKFLLTDSQREIISDRLKWIVSLPLLYRDGPTDRAMGVLNVDGLDGALDVQEMKALADALSDPVYRVAAQLAKLPKSRITITVEDSADVPAVHLV